MSRQNDKSAAAPQPIPPPQQQQQQNQQRRNSFTGWSQTLFGTSPIARPPTFTNGVSPSVNFPIHPAHSLSGTIPNSLPDQGPPAFSGIGLFRRFSASQASANAPPHPLLPAQHQESVIDSTNVQHDIQSVVGPGQAISGASFHKEHHPQSKVLDEVRGSDDPPSRPDSRMRNLMLSGQFML